jgi:hypothetical protein
MGSLLRGFLTRRLIRFLPGGWLAYLLFSSRTRRLARAGWQRYRRR